MRIVIDMQGAQSEGSRNRGIGRYSLSFALAMVRNRGEHEIILALNGLFPETIEPIRAAFYGLLSQKNIRVWYAVAPVTANDPNNTWRRQTAELVRETFLASLSPDIVHVSSLFEGFGDSAVTSIGKAGQSVSTAVTLYDLIPFIYRKPYFDNQAFKAWYLQKIEYMRQADLWLTISESSRQEGISHLGLSEERTVNVSTDANACFQKRALSIEAKRELQEKYGLIRSFVMYTGGIDHRKNIEGLIRAFSKLPASLRNAHQLAIVCSVQPENRDMLEQLAAQQGLGKDELILTGFVPEEDLVALYNICTLFVFPSWHEGFGLPLLEAMRCGAPVIGANTSSLPEVIGLDEAMFDPHSDEAITQIMERGLSDDLFRSRLAEHGETQATKFSWDESARRAIAAMERLVAERQEKTCSPLNRALRPKLAYISPFPPERSGIAEYSAELLPELARHYDIDAIIDQDALSDPWIEEHCPIRSVQWFAAHACSYERVLYHFGNSACHQHMFDLLKSIPGVVVLHDFYLSGVLCHMEAIGYTPGCWTQELYNSHGYVALCDRFRTKNAADMVWKYPCSLDVIQNSLGVIVHSSNSLRLARHWYRDELTEWTMIPLLRDSQDLVDKKHARITLGIAPEDFVVCSFGSLGPTKCNHRLLGAWLHSDLGAGKKCHLVFVGENDSNDYGMHLLEAIRQSGGQNIHITGWVDKDLFCLYLAAADIAVQLRTLSRGETSATVLDCMNYGVATIVNANGSMAELDNNAVWMLPDTFSDEQLIAALETLRQDGTLRRSMGDRARKIILDAHNPQSCAGQYCVAIERFYKVGRAMESNLLSALAKLPGPLPGNAELIPLANSLADTFPFGGTQKQLLVDVSELVQRDAKTGIQRVVRNLLKEWLDNPPAGYRVEPVYASAGQGYRYARKFTLNFIECPSSILVDDPIECRAGDVFLGLDLQPQVVPTKRTFYQKIRGQGVRVVFAVYDLLCLQMPQYFFLGAEEDFSRWLEVVAECDGVVCISETVANELTEWIRKNGLPQQRRFNIDWFHLGADVTENLELSIELPSDANTVLGKISKNTSFLMVGTLEPRKGYVQVLDAFDDLWNSGHDVNLVIVGKQGWMVADLVDRLHAHNERNHRLFWLEDVSDDYLVQVYAVCTCLVAASYGEGFGLPLIEAAQHKLPIIARDIPVFHEVAGEHAYFFHGLEPVDLASAIREWLALYQAGRHPKSDDMPWLTWKESAQHLLECVLGDFKTGRISVP